jgi:hypothetical protein
LLLLLLLLLLLPCSEICIVKEVLLLSEGILLKLEARLQVTNTNVPDEQLGHGGAVSAPERAEALHTSPPLGRRRQIHLEEGDDGGCRGQKSLRLLWLLRLRRQSVAVAMAMASVGRRVLGRRTQSSLEKGTEVVARLQNGGSSTRVG